MWGVSFPKTETSLKEVRESCFTQKYLFCVFQECDQVHIDDVSSDDNGQDLRYNTGTLSVFDQIVKVNCCPLLASELVC